MARFTPDLDGTANLRANEKSPSHSVPTGPSGKGPDCGGTPNLRADAQAPATSIPASGPGPVAKRLPFDTFEDRTV